MNRNTSDKLALRKATTLAVQLLQLSMTKFLDKSDMLPYLTTLVPATLRQLQVSKDKEPVIRLLEETMRTSFGRSEPYIDGTLLNILPFLKDRHQHIQLASLDVISALFLSVSKTPIEQFGSHLVRVTSEIVDLLYHDDLPIRRSAWSAFISIASLLQGAEDVSFDLRSSFKNQFTPSFTQEQAADADVNIVLKKTIARHLPYASVAGHDM